MARAGWIDVSDMLAALLLIFAMTAVLISWCVPIGIWSPRAQRADNNNARGDYPLMILATFSGVTGSIIPRSVMMAVMSPAGVTSKAGQ